MTLEIFKKNTFLKSIPYFLIDLPLISSVYKQIYKKRIISYLQKKRQESITIEPFNVCNLNCVMCPYQKMTRPKVKMPMNIFKKIVDEAKDANIKNINMTSYNEAFLDDLLFERIKYIKQNKLTVSFFSNGTTLTKEKIEKLLSCPPDLLIFSFDSNNKKTYEYIRKGANFDKTRQNIINLINQKKKKKMLLPIIQINMVIMNKNKKEIDSFKKFWNKKADRIDFGTVDNRTDNSVLKIIGKSQTKTPYPCKRAFYDLGVLSDGRVTFCECQDFDGKFIVGDIKKQSLKEILNSEKYNAYKKAHLDFKGDKIPLCKNCTYLYKSCFDWWF